MVKASTMVFSQLCMLSHGIIYSLASFQHGNGINFTSFLDISSKISRWVIYMYSIFETRRFCTRWHNYSGIQCPASKRSPGGTGAGSAGRCGDSGAGGPGGFWGGDFGWLKIMGSALTCPESSPWIHDDLDWFRGIFWIWGPWKAFLSEDLMVCQKIVPISTWPYSKIAENCWCIRCAGLKLFQEKHTVWIYLMILHLCPETGLVIWVSCQVGMALIAKGDLTCEETCFLGVWNCKKNTRYTGTEYTVYCNIPYTE